MKVLVTGATGFLGARTCRFLRAQGLAVRAMGRNTERLAELKTEGMEALAGDLCNREDRDRAVEGCSAVVHAGALSSAWGRRETFLQTNHVATRELLTSARAAGCETFVFISSPSIYFDFAHRRGINENDPLPKRFVNAYAESKWLAEQEVLASDLRTVILRPQAIFGEGETALLPRILRTARAFGVPDLGNPVLDLTYVDNVCHAITLGLGNPRATGVFNITNNQPVALLPFLKDLLARLGVPWRSARRSPRVLLGLAAALEGIHKVFLPDTEPLLTRYAVGVLAYDRTLDLSRAQEVLGYQPLVSLEEGVARFVRAYGS